MSSEPALFPLFLKLSGVPVLVVGGGPVATSKIDGLLVAGARITVVAPDVADAIRAMDVLVVQRPFEEADLDDAWYVVAAATPEVNAHVSRAAASRKLFVNAVDDPPNATAYLGGVVRRSGATIAISTGGRAPALAGLLREGLEALLPSEAQLDEWFEASDHLKRHWRSTGVPMGDRRAELAGVVARRYCGTMPSCRARRDDHS